MSTELQTTIHHLVVHGKGILAADESTSTITKRLQTINVECTEENRRNYRELMFTSPGLNTFISGVILFEETLKQKAIDGTLLPHVLSKQNIIPGIKVDKGTIPLTNSPGDTVTQGLDGLADRLKEYKIYGARFAKWRAVLPITSVNPHHLAIATNAEMLARYAAICQEQGIVPIVEPEVLMDGDHTIERCATVTETVLQHVFFALYHHKVKLEYIILKPNMVISGKNCPQQADVKTVAQRTIDVLHRTVPTAVPSINFLSGGQSDEDATIHLNAMNQQPNPWSLSFSYGRALQAPCLKAWAGKAENKQKAQKALYEVAKRNGAACLGKFKVIDGLV